MLLKTPKLFLFIRSSSARIGRQINFSKLHAASLTVLICVNISISAVSASDEWVSAAKETMLREAIV